jgi:hypothetical protein
VQVIRKSYSLVQVIRKSYSQVVFTGLVHHSGSVVMLVSGGRECIPCCSIYLSGTRFRWIVINDPSSDHCWIGCHRNVNGIGRAGEL